MRYELRMPSPDSVAASQTATIKLPIGNRYHELQLKYSGMTLAHMQEIRVYINGVVRQRFSAEDRDSMNQFDGLAAAAGILKIPFDRQGLRTTLGEELTAIDTGKSLKPNTQSVQSFYIEVDISAGATNPAIALNATVSDSLGMGAGAILHIKKDVRTFGGAGTMDISDVTFPSQTAQQLNRTWFKPSNGELSKIRVERNTTVLFERDRDLNEFIQGDGVRLPQVGFQVVDRTERGLGGDTIPLIGATDFRYIVDASAAMTVTIYSENIGVLGD